MKPRHQSVLSVSLWLIDLSTLSPIFHAFELNYHLICRVDKLDEMKCLITGCNFLLKNIPNECFTFDRGDEKRKHKYHFQSVDSRTLFPYLLVNIGSGVSILKVGFVSKFIPVIFLIVLD